jgi:hypothetical protein
MTYGSDSYDGHRIAGTYVGRILKGGGKIPRQLVPVADAAMGQNLPLRWLRGFRECPLARIAALSISWSIL